VVKRLGEGKADTTSRFLYSENPAYIPIPVTGEVQIQGVVVKVERDL
jgi:SOS-response transcriptional repressor LexA